jgi:hypothetical protein
MGKKEIIKTYLYNDRNGCLYEHPGNLLIFVSHIALQVGFSKDLFSADSEISLSSEYSHFFISALIFGTYQKDFLRFFAPDIGIADFQSMQKPGALLKACDYHKTHQKSKKIRY